MGVMDFLKGLFSSKQEDQSLNNISEPGSGEPTQDAPQSESSSEDMNGADDSSIQE
jgi:hypothetical protein